jgi:S-DNA-T family DNA segregation ATPase FtsK/SpoIIIE
MSLEKLVNNYTKEFRQNILDELSEYRAKYDLFHHEIEAVSMEQIRVLDGHENAYADSSSTLIKRCEYLKAEVWRYKHLLEEFNKLDSTPQMVERLEELKQAIDEYTEGKLHLHNACYQTKKEEIQEDFQRLLNDLKVRIELLKEEYQSKFDQRHDNFISFVETTVESNKGTASVSKLVGYNVANYDATSGAVRIGTSYEEFRTPGGLFRVDFPDVIDFQDGKNIVVIYNDDSASAAEDITDGLIIRTLASNIPDKLKIHIFDTKMYEKFHEFMRIPSRVMTRGYEMDAFIDLVREFENEIRQKLSLLWSDIRSGNQSIRDYNQKKIQAEKYDEVLPYRLFVLDNFLAMVGKTDYSELFDRIGNLTRYGSNFIMLFKEGKDTDHLQEVLSHLPESHFYKVDFTGRYINEFKYTANYSTSNLSDEDKITIVNSFSQSYEDLEQNRAKVKFIAYYSKDKSQWFTGKVGNQVKIPIGTQTNSDGLEYLYFKTKEGLSNALVCGGVGSGKTNFLKTVITSVALQYSPAEVEMYLIDMKNGAGFSVFQTHQLPHVKLFAFSAENELIRDVFENLKAEMEQRYKEYAKYNIDNLDDVYKDSNLAPFAPKRTIVIIDEFASIFTEDGLYLDEIASNILNIVQKGRAMGINLLLATQNFNNIRNSAFTQAVTLIPTRILLKSSIDAALSILGMSNSNAAKEITRIGEGLINCNYGELNSDGGNSFFKSFLLDNDDLIPVLLEIRQEVEARNLNAANAMFIDSSKEAVFTANEALFSGGSSSENFKKIGIPCWLGESFLMKKENHFSFQWKINSRSYYQNVLVSGNEREYSMQAIYSILSSISYRMPEIGCALKIINPFDYELSADLGINNVMSSLEIANPEIFTESELGYVLNQLNALQEIRRGTDDRTPVIVFIPGLEKFIQLHSEYGDNELARLLKSLMNSGSSFGIYFVVEINKPSNLQKIHRDLIGCFEHRICFSVNTEESEFIVNTKVAAQLIDMDNQHMRSKAIYYAQSTQEQTKYKSYVNLQAANALINAQIPPCPNNLMLSGLSAKPSALPDANSGSIDISSIPEGLMMPFPDDNE